MAEIIRLLGVWPTLEATLTAEDFTTFDYGPQGTLITLYGAANHGSQHLVVNCDNNRTEACVGASVRFYRLLLKRYYNHPKTCETAAKRFQIFLQSSCRLGQLQLHICVHAHKSSIELMRSVCKCGYITSGSSVNTTSIF
jgi:hypothetical protein